MKISVSALQFTSSVNKTSTLATLDSTKVRVLSNSGSEQDNASDVRSASITQTQQQTLTDTISSRSTSHIVNSETGEQSYLESAHLAQSISEIIMEESLTVHSVQAIGGDRLDDSITSIEVTSITQFESNTTIQSQAAGKVLTEDGREIDFLLELNYERDIKVQQTGVFSGHKDLIDPLVINLNGSAPALSDSYFEFDLDSDSNVETLHQTANGTGFLAFDKNQNGIIDNGSELFGPNSGYGFNELSQYDEDGNGWIDENDSIFTQLSFMDFDDQGQQRLQDISSVGLGAIALQSSMMDFAMYDSDGNFQAQVANQGIALKENGQVVSVQELYFADQAFGIDQLAKPATIQYSSDVAAIENESPLTQFQFDNVIINSRNANTHVMIDFPEYNNRLRFGQSDPDLNIEAAVALQSSMSPDESSTANHNTTNIEVSQQAEAQQTEPEKKQSIQAYFQEKIKNNDYSEINHTSKQTIKFPSVSDDFNGPTQTQSIFWQDERARYEIQAKDGGKINQLKQLVEDLKEIREQQKNMQGKLEIYLQVEEQG